jgi:dihydrofolate reductase
MAAQQPAAGIRPVQTGAGKVFIHFTMSLDGFIADAEGRVDWAFGFGGPSPQEVREIIASIGAALAGRRGYDLGMMRGAKLYGGAWSGPQFVLTHRPGDAPAGPSVTFLSGSVREAVETARTAAGGKDVVVVGASIAQQCLAEGLVDEILIHLVPVLLGGGVPLFASNASGPINLEKLSIAESGSVVTLRLRRDPSRPAGDQAVVTRSAGVDR